MKTSKPRRKPLRRKTTTPLRANISERSGITLNAPKIPLMPQTVMLTPPPKPTKDILALLLACTGFAIAAKSDASVELMPGTPTTVVVTSNGKAQAAFVLPITEAEACKAFGMPVPMPRDRNLERLWEEDRRAC